MSEILSFPLWEITRVILQSLPVVLFNPSYALIFWLLVGFVALQYSRLARTERTLFGTTRVNVWRRTLEALAHGVFGGLIASYALVLTGITLGTSDILYLWPVALGLMLIHPRFICFSYAGGLVSASHLLLGWPDVNVAGIIGLVAVLHVVEGVLVWLGAAESATPVYVRHRSGRTVGGFTVQRFWPVPLVALLMIAMPEGMQAQTIPMPDWWPLVGYPDHLLGGTRLAPVLFPVAAALGYADIAISRDPGQRSRRAAGHLLLYSLTLLALAVAAATWRPLLWLAAVSSAGLHEWMIQAGLRGELNGRARFVAPPQGVMVMDVFPGGLGERLDLQRGDVIARVNGQPLQGRRSLEQALRAADFYLELDVARDGRMLRVDTNRFRYRPGVLGIVAAPEPGDRPQVQTGGRGFLHGLLARLRGWIRHGRR